MNCADDLTAVDIDEAQPGSLQASSTSSSSSLFPLIEFHLSHALNVNDAVQDPLKRVLRPLDSKDAVLTNDELVGTEHEAEGGLWTAGCIETQDGDDELLIHVRKIRRISPPRQSSSHAVLRFASLNSCGSSMVRSPSSRISC